MAKEQLLEKTRAKITKKVPFFYTEPSYLTISTLCTVVSFHLQFKTLIEFRLRGNGEIERIEFMPFGMSLGFQETVVQFFTFPQCILELPQNQNVIFYWSKVES